MYLRDQAVLYIGNHRSYFDILLTYFTLPEPDRIRCKKR